MRTVYRDNSSKFCSEDITRDYHVGHWIHDGYRRQRLSIDIDEVLGRSDLGLCASEDHRLLINHYSTAGGDRLTDLRWEYPDPYDTTLAWVTRISLLRAAESLLISLDLAVAGVGPMLLPATFKLGSPRVIRDISRLPSVFLGGHTYDLTPEFIGAGEVELLAAELLDKTRPYPVVVVSRKVDNDTPLIDAADLASGLPAWRKSMS
jgi:hypothetical protein